MSEQAKARQEACCNASETEYFGARPQIDTLMQRHNFCAGFYRGYAAALAARAPADSVLEDAARYQWIRGPGEESTRYSRWSIEYWDGPNGWQPMQRERMDSAIDTARKQGANHD